jgi:hypothetical protein
VAVPGLSTATAVSAGYTGSCALLADHSVSCWGRNDQGEVGDGTTTHRLSPVAVVNVSTATAISVGGCHVCAVLADKTVTCWGGNEVGQLGDNTTTDRHVAVAVVWRPKAAIVALPTWTANTSVPVSWSALAGTNAVASYDVRYRRAAWNGGFGGYVLWRSASTATSATLSVSRGSTYCVSTQARDTIGTLSAWSAETCTAVPLDDRSLSRSAGWGAGTGVAYYARTYLRATRYGATLTRTHVVARRIAIVATTCSTCGSVRVYLNRTLLRTISLHSSTTVNRQLIAVKTFSSTHSGTITIKVISSGKKVVIDGLAIRRN